MVGADRHLQPLPVATSIIDTAALSQTSWPRAMNSIKHIKAISNVAIDVGGTRYLIKWSDTADDAAPAGAEWVFGTAPAIRL